MNPSETFFSNKVPAGVYPPASIRWKYASTTVPAGWDEWVVPWQVATPLGVLTVAQWTVTDIFFRVDNASSSASSAVQIGRYTGTAGYSVTNYLNDTPIVIPSNQNECAGRPYTSATINNPLVNAGDKLQPVITLGAGASLVSLYVVFMQYQGG